MTLEKFLQDNYNYNPDIKNNIKSYITLWKGLYAGNVKDFHNYYIYNGQKRVFEKEVLDGMCDLLIKAVWEQN